MPMHERLFATVSCVHEIKSKHGDERKAAIDWEEVIGGGEYLLRYHHLYIEGNNTCSQEGILKRICTLAP